MMHNNYERSPFYIKLANVSVTASDTVTLKTKLSFKKLGTRVLSPSKLLTVLISINNDNVAELRQ